MREFHIELKEEISMFPFKRVVLALGAVLIPAFSWAAQFSIDPAHSAVIFKVKHLSISTVTGRFEKFSGTFDFDGQGIKSSKVEAVITAASINTDVSKRDEHLRSADFFDVEKYPELKFVSKGVKDVKKNKFKILGDLTMHGVTKPVVLDAEFGGEVKDPWGNTRVGFNAATKINRKEYGLTYGKALETGGLVVGEEVTIILEIEGIKK